MKALNCPTCSAPVVVKKGLAKQTCAFCESELALNIGDAEELKEIPDNIFKKYQKRTEDSFKRGFIKRYTDQWMTLSDYIGDDLTSDKSIDIRAKAFSTKSYYFLWSEYGLEKGSTVSGIEREIKYANTLGAAMSWTRLDKHYTDTLIFIEDYCEKLDEETKNKFLKAYYKHYKNDLFQYVDIFYNHLIKNLSWTKDSEGGIVKWDGPVKVACAFKYDSYAMFFKFFNDLKTFELLPTEALDLSDQYKRFKEKDVQPAHRFFGSPASEWAYKESISDAESQSKEFEIGLEPIKAEAMRIREEERKERLRLKIETFLQDPYNNHTGNKNEWASTNQFLNSKQTFIKQFNRFAKDFEEAGKFNESIRVDFKKLVQDFKPLIIKPKIVLLVAIVMIPATAFISLIIFIVYLIWLNKMKTPLLKSIKELEQKAFDSI